jgi:hypothetical protein
MIIQSTPVTAQISGQYFVGTWVNTGAVGPYQENSGAFAQAIIAYSNGGYLLQLWARNGADAGSNWLTIDSESMRGQPNSNYRRRLSFQCVTL